MMYGTRKITDPIEIEAWKEYERVLNKYHELYKVRNFDRVSIHKAFPEIAKAFRGVQQCELICTLKADYNKNDEDDD